MRVLATVKTALRALRRNKMRSVLTGLGIIIGVGAVIAMVSIGNGAKAQVEAQIASLGENVLLVFPGSITSSGLRTGWGGSARLMVEDAEQIAREIPGVVAVSPEVHTQRQVAAGNQNWFTRIVGEDANYFDMRRWALKEGAPFSEYDVRRVAKVAVIGTTLARQLFGERSPLGETIRVQNVPFTVIGVLTSRGFSMMGYDQDDVMVIPYTSAMKRVIGTHNLSIINVQAANAAVLASVQQQVTALLRQRHHLPPDEADDFTIRSQEEISQAATATSRILTMLLGAIASVSLFVGGIGIMNIMLVSVTERTREIGIRMAVGARGRDILMQFLMEAITLSSIGGVIGIILGIGSSKLLAALAQWPTLITSAPVIVAFFFSAAVGVFFGFYPARKASRLDPIEALRYE
ncbi:MAG TPA: ABC transporter permease [Verrucomicrobiae bacterium]|nr:ABC transporter permease [Verrucomicrobiae bacterium]